MQGPNPVRFSLLPHDSLIERTKGTVYSLYAPFSLPTSPIRRRRYGGFSVEFSIIIAP